jgi:hypothetical protein
MTNEGFHDNAEFSLEPYSLRLSAVKTADSLAIVN